MPPAVLEMLKPEYVTPGGGLSWLATKRPPASS